MINSPSVDKMIETLSQDNKPVSRYALCTIVAKRTRQLIEQTKAHGNDTGDKEMVLACKEIVDGKLTYTKD